LTKVRASGEAEAINITRPRALAQETALEFADDESAFAATPTGQPRRRLIAESRQRTRSRFAASHRRVREPAGGHRPGGVVAWGAIVGLGKVNPRAAGPAWWAAALGSLALGLALLPWAALRSPVPPVLQALLGFGALLAALEGMLRFRRWPGEARR